MHPQKYISIIASALTEDIQSGDLTSESIFNPDDMCHAQLIAKQAHLQNQYNENDSSNNYNGSPYLDEEFKTGNLVKIDSKKSRRGP